MERITSRKNARIRHFRQLARSGEYRRERGEFLCDGEKLLAEALSCGASVREILWREDGTSPSLPLPEASCSYTAPGDIFDFASPLENSPGPLFTVSMQAAGEVSRPRSAIVLESVQDPGNVGTILRTAAALGCELVLLTGRCADPYNPKTVRAAMGALFRQRVLELPLPRLGEQLAAWELPLYGAALTPDAADIRRMPLRNAAVAVGNEGKGLSAELLGLCAGKVIIPMTPGSESLNAAAAAAILLWEMQR